MDKFQLIFRGEPEQLSFDAFDFQKLKSTLDAALRQYEGIIYTEENLSYAKTDKKKLSRLRRELDDRRKEIKRSYLQPYLAFEAQIKELLSQIDIPFEHVKSFLSEIDTHEKEAKREEIKHYFFQKSDVLFGGLTEIIWESPAFFDPKWLNKTTSMKTWQSEIDMKIAQIHRDLQSIWTAAGPLSDALILKYLETLQLDGLQIYRAKLTQVSRALSELYSCDSSEKIERIPADIFDRRTGSQIWKLVGSPDLLAQAGELLQFLNLNCELLQDETPQPLSERTIPDFDTFVAFDLETTGTYGVVNGDLPAEITEISAVRVINGVITETFSQLVNPGRKILPRITRLTGITNDMVANQPDVQTAICLFADFIGNYILVGHNIKASDLHFLDRAAKKAGVTLKNSFFDTYRFARSFKESQNWEKLSLEYLAAYFHIEQLQAHRALSDAKINAELYQKLQTLYIQFQKNQIPKNQEKVKKEESFYDAE